MGEGEGEGEERGREQWYDWKIDHKNNYSGKVQKADGIGLTTQETQKYNRQIGHFDWKIHIFDTFA